MFISDILKTINGEVINGVSVDNTFNDIVTNSREVKERDIFIALSGNNYDGHEFIEDAITKGASAIIVSKHTDTETNIPLIMVSDTKEALIQIGAYYRNNFKGKVIAITGSAGKTMTKELIYNILSKKYKVLKNEGNKNNHIGVPLTLSKLNNDYEFAVIEVGMNHKGEISKLSSIIKPNTSVITNIGTSHIGNLGSQKNIFKAKLEILDGMDSGTLIINNDDKYLKKIKCNKKIDIIKFDDLTISKIESTLYTTKFNIKYKEKNYEFLLNVPGSYLVKNCLLAIKVGIKYNVSFEDIIGAIKEYKPLNNRLNIQKIDNNILIDDCYNSNYESVISLINYLKNIDRDKVIILGDILELGKYSKKIHKKIGKILNKNKFHNLLFVGKYMYYAHRKNKKSKYFHNNNELIEYLKKINIDNSIILVKGSRGMHLESVVEYFIKK